MTGDVEGAADEPAARTPATATHPSRMRARARALAACGSGSGLLISADPTKAEPHVPPTFIVRMWNRGTLHVMRAEGENSAVQLAHVSSVLSWKVDFKPP